MAGTNKPKFKKRISIEFDIYAPSEEQLKVNEKKFIFTLLRASKNMELDLTERIILNFMKGEMGDVMPQPIVSGSTQLDYYIEQLG